MNEFKQPAAKNDRTSNNYVYDEAIAIYEINRVIKGDTVETARFTSMLTLAGLARKYALRDNDVELSNGGQFYIGNSTLYINWNDDVLPTGCHISHVGFDDGIYCATAITLGTVHTI